MPLSAKGKAQSSFPVNRHQGSLPHLPAPTRTLCPRSLGTLCSLGRPPPSPFSQKENIPQLLQLLPQRCPLFCASVASPFLVGPGSFLNFPHFRMPLSAGFLPPFCAFLTFLCGVPHSCPPHRCRCITRQPPSAHRPSSVSSTSGCCHQMCHSATLLCQALGNRQHTGSRHWSPSGPHSSQRLTRCI